jgi:imidazole glycerol-phosphate synthase subunit HisH
MTTNVLVVDYGVGNVLSVCRSFEYCGANVKLSDSLDDITRADRVVLPGVGAINHCMDELEKRGMIEPLAHFSQTERPFLGICVGMQMMMDISWEFSESKCFGWISGEVVEIPRQGSNKQPHKIPHIGWNTLELPVSRSNWDGTILEGIGEDEPLYFVHSFMVDPQDDNSRLSNTRYNGINICAALNRGAINGTQFHPEKSGAVGLRIIQNFINM